MCWCGFGYFPDPPCHPLETMGEATCMIQNVGPLQLRQMKILQCYHICYIVGSIYWTQQDIWLCSATHIKSMVSRDRIVDIKINLSTNN